jgi:hypothetical protein
VLRRRAKSAAFILGCCLLTAFPGCAFHRTSEGFVLCGHWTLERNRESPGSAAIEAEAGPELLPWRSRLKGLRLGSRLFHARRGDGEALTAAADSDPLDALDDVATAPEPKRPDPTVEE